MTITSKSKLKEASISAIVIRADGTIQDLGVIASMKRESKLKKFLKFNLI